MPTYNYNIFGNTFGFLNSKWFSLAYWFNLGATFLSDVLSFIVHHGREIISVYHTILFFLAMFFITLLCYCAVRMFEIRKKEHAHLHHEILEYAHHQAEREKKKHQGEAVSTNPRWVQTLNYLFSPNSGDWKLAVIEADTMLDTLLEQLGFKGDTMGDKLKSAAVPNPTSGDKFRSLTSAWEVHTVRNRIAHEGADFQLSQHEAKRVVAIYEHIFREFGFI